MKIKKKKNFKCSEFFFCQPQLWVTSRWWQINLSRILTRTFYHKSQWTIVHGHAWRHWVLYVTRLSISTLLVTVYCQLSILTKNHHPSKWTLEWISSFVSLTNSLYLYMCSMPHYCKCYRIFMNHVKSNFTLIWRHKVFFLNIKMCTIEICLLFLK